MKKKISISITKEQRLWFTTIISSIHIKYIQKLPSHDIEVGEIAGEVYPRTQSQLDVLQFQQSQVTKSVVYKLLSLEQKLLSPGNLVEMQNQHHESAALEVELSTQYYSKPSR